MDERDTEQSQEQPTLAPQGTTPGPAPAGPALARAPGALASTPVAALGGRLGPRTVIDLQRAHGNAAVARMLIARQPAPAEVKDKPTGKPRVPDPAAALATANKHLATTLPKEELKRVQTLLEATAEMHALDEQIDPLRKSILHEDVVKREALEKKRGEWGDKYHASETLLVPTDKILGDDFLLPPDGKADPREVAFRSKLYRRLLEFNVAAKTHVWVENGEVKFEFDRYFWGPHSWLLWPDESGRITFKQCMHVQKWNLEYQAILTRTSIELLEGMEEIAREQGGVSHNLDGKTLGKLPGMVWKTNVNVLNEVGKTQGYVDDGRGKAELYSKLYGAKTGRLVVRAPDGRLHLYALDEKLDPLLDFGKPSDGIARIASTGEIAGVEQVIGYDGTEYKWDGKSWSAPASKNALGSIEKFAIGAIFGDFWEEPGIESTMGQIFIGVIPVVGQIADARDVAAGIYKMWETGGKDGKLQTALALVGFIPVFGDAIKAAKSGGKKAVQEAVQDMAPAATKKLATELAQDASKVATRFGVKGVKDAFPDLTDLLKKAASDPAAAAELAGKVEKQLADAGGNAGVVVMSAGGKWSELAKALKNGGDKGAAVGEKLSLWREAEFDGLAQRMKEMSNKLSSDLGQPLEAPSFARTGTKAFTSDVDISFVGKDASIYAQSAKTDLAKRFNMPYDQVQKLLDLDVFTDPTRMVAFQKLDSKLAAGVEKTLVNEAELNTLAKMIREGADEGRVKDMAKNLGVKMDDVTARASELAEFADPVKRLQFELKIDDLHRQFDAAMAAKDGVKAAALAQEMARLQGKLNAAVKGAYVTPGGVAANVAIRDNVAAARDFAKMTPAMRYMAVLDDLAMIEPVLTKINKSGFDLKSAKDMVKYADRLLVRAGALGAFDVSKLGKARELFEQIVGLLGTARRNPAELTQKAGRYLAEAGGILDIELEAIIKAAQKAGTPADEVLVLTKQLEAVRKVNFATRVIIVDEMQQDRKEAAAAPPP